MGCHASAPVTAQTAPQPPLTIQVACDDGRVPRVARNHSLASPLSVNLGGTSSCARKHREACCVSPQHTLPRLVSHPTVPDALFCCDSDEELSPALALGRTPSPNECWGPPSPKVLCSCCDHSFRVHVMDSLIAFGCEETGCCKSSA